VEQPVSHLLCTAAFMAVAPFGLSTTQQPHHEYAAAYARPMASPTTGQGQTVTYQIVTNEIKAKQTDGSNVEVYRFDPGVYVVRQGDQVNLRIYGLNGHNHPVLLEGYNVQAVVHRNQTTTLSFRATKTGTYRLICTSHMDAAHEGPMEGYLVVMP
jgi:plastocyanin